MQRDLTFAIIGAGSRGSMFADWLAKHYAPDCVVAVAEPDPARLAALADRHEVKPEMRFDSWETLIDRPKLADVAINTTMDRQHRPSAIALLGLGYHMLLEKPMATSLEDCAAIDEARRLSGRIVSVCHSLRYHASYVELRRLIESGAIGQVISYDQLEAVENVHQSHSFVRGNWGNEERSTFMLLSKSCHDIDIVADMIGSPCTSASSFGSLSFFRRENAPKGAPPRCVDGCPVQKSCPYDAVRLYADERLWTQYTDMRLASTRSQILDMLHESPYGRCVFQTDNDVVDHQVVALEFEGGVTATFTMTAFTPWGGRYVRVHGTKGYIEAKIDQRQIDMWEFWENNRHTRIDVPGAAGSHGGADDTVIRTLIAAIESNDASSIRTSTEESLRTHAIAFAAERSRREGRTVAVSGT